MTTSLSSHLLGCLVRDLHYGPWPVTEDCIYIKSCLTVWGTIHQKHMKCWKQLLVTVFVGEHRLLIGFLNSNLTKLKLKIMSITLFCYKDTHMTMWRKFQRLLTKTEEEPFWRLWPVRPLECNVPADCKRGLECAVCVVCVLLSY
jgi:hypothetical protein